MTKIKTLKEQSGESIYPLTSTKAVVDENGNTIEDRLVVADGEDLVADGNVLRLKDRPNTDGMGYVILRKDKTFQEQVTKPNTIYEIRYDFDLGRQEKTVVLDTPFVLPSTGGAYYRTGDHIDVEAGMTVDLPSGGVLFDSTLYTLITTPYTPSSKKSLYVGKLQSEATLGQSCVYSLEKEVVIPEGCVLDFQGGKFKNGVIVGTYTFIKENIDCFYNIIFKGSFINKYISITSFGAKSANNVSDVAKECSDEINDAINSEFPTIFIPTGLYLVRNTISVSKPVNIIGENSETSVLQCLWGTSNTIVKILPTLQKISIKKLTISGRDSKENSNTGLQCATEEGEETKNDSELKIEDVIISYCRGDGIYIKARAVYINNVKIRTIGNIGINMRGTDHTIYNTDLYVCGKGGLYINGGNIQGTGITLKICGNTEGENSLKLNAYSCALDNVIIQQTNGNGVYVNGKDNRITGLIDAVGKRNTSVPILLTERAFSNFIEFNIINNTLGQSFINAYNIHNNAFYNKININISRYCDNRPFSYTEKYTPNFLNSIKINGVENKHNTILVTYRDTDIDKNEADSSFSYTSNSTLFLYFRSNGYVINNYVRKEVEIKYYTNNGLIYASALASCSNIQGTVSLGFKIIDDNGEHIIHNFKDTSLGFEYVYYRIAGTGFRRISDWVDLSLYNNISKVYILIEANLLEGVNKNFDATITNLEYCADSTSSSNTIPIKIGYNLPTKNLYDGFNFYSLEKEKSMYYINGRWVDADGNPVTRKIGVTSDRPTDNLYIGCHYYDTTLNKPLWWNGSAWVDALGMTANNVYSEVRHLINGEEYKFLTTDEESKTTTIYAPTQIESDGYIVAAQSGKAQFVDPADIGLK